MFFIGFFKILTLTDELFFRKFAPELPVVLYHGSQQERQELRSKHLGETHTITVSKLLAILCYIFL